ncbi:hypothetical protein Vretimale_12313, partial [Volvox reticuliferus]
DSMRCLFLANALEGAAKTWHDQWTNARDTYTSEELLEALLARFAPQIQSRATEARHKLSAGKYRMRPGESVSSYQSRFEALVTPIAGLSDSERVFWFQQGLSADLSGECATDLTGSTFESYKDLVRFALGAETRFTARRIAEKQARPKLNALSIQDMGADEDPLDETPAPPPKRPRTASARTDTNGQEGQPREGKGAGKSKRGGQKGRNLAPKEGQVQKGHKGKDPMEFLDTFKCTRREFLHRKQKGICLRCGSDQHRVDTCPIMLAEDPKGKGH